ncbi:phospholipase C 2 precursor [mine drainage metagenome]|uniref:Phospholipase C 2 n=1 Tax=mine drainage metagenome TaxID=410659 RepID=A0A1J5TNR7_9ZZZZ
MLRFILTFLISAIITTSQANAAEPALTRINHIIVIYLENHSFDNLYGLFPGANGLDQAVYTHLQTDEAGKPYSTLPAIKDVRFPHALGNRPFPIEQYVPANEKTDDLVHRFYQNQAQINGGRNDRFAGISDAAGLVMGYYDGSKLPLWQYAKKYTLADNFYQAAFGGSFLNHFWLVCACTPSFPNASDNLRASLDAHGNLIKDGAVTPDGYAVNTLQPMTMPYRKSTLPAKRLPLQTLPTIGDRLSEKDISWAWYSGGWNDAINGHADKEFQYHHQPFGYFKNFAEDTQGRLQHLKDESDFIADIKNGNLPAVSFYKPLGTLNEHPGYTDILSGEKHIAEIISHIENSKLWKDSLIIVTYDENGGFWDHVAPPVKDRWGPGLRVPTLIISPYAKRGFVDHTQYDTTSILKFIETRYKLNPLGTRDGDAANLTNSLELN